MNTKNLSQNGKTKTSDLLFLMKMKAKTIRVKKPIVSNGALMPEIGTLGTTYDKPYGLMVCRFSPPYKTSLGNTVLPREEGDEVIVYFFPNEIEFLNDD